ncbi:MAG: 30S ribosomal protein S20 [Clostridia bacterium]|nr:30S ribosomal protein S20 [Clostridia bacterium]
MPNIKSAKKRVKVSEKKNLRNRIVKSTVHTSVKKFEAAVAADPANAAAQLSATASAIDKAVIKGVVHKNAANRKKARLAKRLAKAAV